jgi:hypothetical protein
MERLYNIVYYFVYRADYRLHLLAMKFNPGILLFERPSIKKRLYRKWGIVDAKEAFNEAFERPDIGISSIRASAFIGCLGLLICYGLSEIIYTLIGVDFKPRLHHLIIYTIINLVVLYYLSYRNDKYLSYFKELDGMCQRDRKKWAWLSFLIIIGILFFFISIFWAFSTKHAPTSLHR